MSFAYWHHPSSYINVSQSTTSSSGRELMRSSSSFGCVKTASEDVQLQNEESNNGSHGLEDLMVNELRSITQQSWQEVIGRKRKVCPLK